MASKLTYYKNSNTGELRIKQQITECKIIFPDYFYDKNRKMIDTNDLTGFVEITENLGCTDIVFSDDYNFTITPSITRLETDNEFKIRLQKEKSINNDIRNRELKQLEYLKKKYENNG